MTLLQPEPSAVLDPPHVPKSSLKALLRRWLPLGVLVVLAVIAYALGLHRYLTLSSLIEHHAYLKSVVAQHLWLALGFYAALYIAVVALSLPGAAALTIVGGLLFGWAINTPVTVIAATIGATIVFIVVKTSLGSVIAEKAGPFVKKLSGGFAKDAFNYLLFLRLVPAVPFFVVNAVAGLCHVALRPFVAATLIGIIPGTLVFSYLGSGLNSVIEAQMRANEACLAQGGDCPIMIDPASLLTPQIIIAFAALAAIAAVPIIVKRLRKV